MIYSVIVQFFVAALTTFLLTIGIYTTAFFDRFDHFLNLLLFAHYPLHPHHTKHKSLFLYDRRNNKRGYRPYVPGARIYLLPYPRKL
jgi:hypothetical protein